MTKIGYLINQYPMPSHTFITNEILELERQGHSVDRFALRGWAGSALSARDEQELKSTRYLLRNGFLPLLAAGVRVALSSPLRFASSIASAWRFSRGSESSGAKHMAYLLEACLLLRWARGSGVQHLHAHFGTNTAEIAALVRCLGGPPYSFTVHGPEEFDKPLQLKLREKARRAKFVAAISSFGRSQLFRWIDLRDWSKVNIVHCGLDTTFLDIPPVPAPRARRLVCVGRLCEQKGQLLLLEAVRLLKNKGVALQLKLAGDGSMRPMVERTICEYELTDSVSITGWLSSEQVKSELLAADALILASFAEGLPVVIMEAMALGRPVIVTSIAGIPELVRDGCDGFLVAPGDAFALAAAVEDFLALDQKELVQMSDQCRIRVRERHNIANEAKKLGALFASSAGT